MGITAATRKNTTENTGNKEKYLATPMQAMKQHVFQ